MGVSIEKAFGPALFPQECILYLSKMWSCVRALAYVATDPCWSQIPRYLAMHESLSVAPTGRCKMWDLEIPCPSDSIGWLQKDKYDADSQAFFTYCPLLSDRLEWMGNGTMETATCPLRSTRFDGKGTADFQHELS